MVRLSNPIRFLHIAPEILIVNSADMWLTRPAYFECKQVKVNPFYDKRPNISQITNGGSGAGYTIPWGPDAPPARTKVLDQKLARESRLVTHIRVARLQSGVQTQERGMVERDAWSRPYTGNQHVSYCHLKHPLGSFSI